MVSSATLMVLKDLVPDIDNWLFIGQRASLVVNKPPNTSSCVLKSHRLLAGESPVALILPQVPHEQTYPPKSRKM
jgi:hypothetical protein